MVIYESREAYLKRLEIIKSDLIRECEAEGNISDSQRKIIMNDFERDLRFFKNTYSLQTNGNLFCSAAFGALVRYYVLCQPVRLLSTVVHQSILPIKDYLVNLIGIYALTLFSQQKRDLEAVVNS